jgi:hypothetical protein
MPVYQGLLSLSQQSPNFSNNAISSLLNQCNIGFAAKTKLLIEKYSGDDVLTNSNKSDIVNSLDRHSYLNIGRYLIDLPNHTAKLLTGELGQIIQDDVQSTFIDHLETVIGFVNTLPTLYGTDADSVNRGINGHFGTLAGTIDSNLQQVANDVTFINSKSLSQDTNFQTALQNLIDYIDTLVDSTAFNSITFQNLLTSIDTAADSFNSALSSGIYAERRTRLISNRSAILDQIALEVSNLGSIITYENSITNTLSYSTLASQESSRNLLLRVSQNPSWKDYFENYATRASYDNPVYNNTLTDSSIEGILDMVLRMRGLPDVTDYVDLDSVARKALRDTRLQGKLGNSRKTTEQIIKEACVLLSISVDYKDVYAQSKSLLSNMNENDREIVKRELDLHNEVNTLS